MKKVIWIAGHGPDRSHDSLHSDVFDTRSDALKFVAGRQYWRISRMEYAAPWSAGKRTDEIGGKDVEREIEKVRQDEQYRTMRRVSDAEALRLWRQRMRERHGPGGTMRNPVSLTTMCRRLADAITGAADRGDPGNFSRAKRLMQFVPEDLAILRMEHPRTHPRDRKKYAYETYIRLTWHPTHPSAVKWLTGHYPAFWERFAKARTMENPRRRGVFLNDNERELWVRNDEFLYSMWRGSGMSMRKFLRANRAAIDNVIVQTLKPDSERPPGYGQYPRSYNPRRGLRTRRSRRR